MKTIKMAIYIMLALFLSGMASCGSEDSINPIPELGNPPFDLPRGEEGSLEELIYSVYEKYGSFVLYDFNQTEFYTTWNGRTVYWYAPVKSGNKDHVAQMVTFMLEKVFAGYPEEFIAKFLPKKIYLVDSICNTSSYNKSNLVNTLVTNNHGLAVSNVGVKMESFTDSDWNSMNSEIVTAIMNNIYNGSLTLRSILIIYLVCENGFVAQYGKSMRKTTWNEKLSLILFAQQHTHMLSERRR